MKHIPLSKNLFCTNAIVVLLFFSIGLEGRAEEAGTSGKHLFILSGQSNMAVMPEEEFTSVVNEAFGEENVIVVKVAQHGKSIMEWYNGWTPPKNAEGKDKYATLPKGRLYKKLINKVKPAIEGQALKSVTFVWMQGERDARMKWADVYEDSLKGLIKQLQQDLGYKDINVVIGRINDFAMDNIKSPHWTKIREIQVGMADADPQIEWIDTDDLNGEKNDIHMTNPQGYKELAERFANKSIAMIKANSN